MSQASATEVTEKKAPFSESKIAGGRNYAALGYSALPFIAGIAYLGASSTTRTYGPSHWFANYRHGFMRRALVGEAFSRVAYLSERTVHRLEVALFAVICVLTALAFRKILFGSIPERRFAAFLLAAPAFLPHMAYMDGELDSFLYIALLLGALALMRLPALPGLAMATVFSVVGLLTHEGFALMFYPLILVLALDLMHSRQLKAGWVATHLAVVILCFAAIVHFGALPGTPGQWIAEAQQRTDMPIEGTVFLVLHFTLKQQLEFVRHLYSAKVVGSILLTLVICIPYFFILKRLLNKTFAARGYSAGHRLLVMLLFACPLALTVLGHDVMRWVSALCINISLFLLLVYRSMPQKNDSQSVLTGWTAAPAYAATLLYLLALGPFGIAGNRFVSNIGSLFGH
ncbi:hypothetical protein [Silvibacterium acidisoli]|uniref:hypothetical protein n=1 Tax=Acidobacteriaceae bacterium ZG23-2 TaxID=2883246 RepID=UPI00406C860F